MKEDIPNGVKTKTWAVTLRSKVTAIIYGILSILHIILLLATQFFWKSGELSRRVLPFALAFILISVTLAILALVRDIKAIKHDIDKNMAILSVILILTIIPQSIGIFISFFLIEAYVKIKR
jgi:uncharacterized YccA/Bax inhibitor family protein